MLTEDLQNFLKTTRRILTISEDGKFQGNFHVIECKVISYFYCNFNLLEFFPHFHIDYYHFICKRRNLS